MAATVTSTRLVLILLTIVILGSAQVPTPEPSSKSFSKKLSERAFGSVKSKIDSLNKESNAFFAEKQHNGGDMEDARKKAEELGEFAKKKATEGAKLIIGGAIDMKGKVEKLMGKGKETDGNSDTENKNREEQIHSVVDNMKSFTGQAVKLTGYAFSQLGNTAYNLGNKLESGSSKSK